MDYRPPVHDDPQVPDWEATQDWTHKPVALVCDHGHDDSHHVCRECAGLFKAIVADVPQLVAELELALTKQTEFLNQGAPPPPPAAVDEAEADPDGPLPSLEWSEGAAQALVALHQAFGGTPQYVARFWLDDWAQVMRNPDVDKVMARVSAAAARGHRVIDRPPTLFEYGPCPKCGTPIRQERVRADEHVHCGKCGYHATLTEHQVTQVNAAVEEWHTYSEIMAMLLVAGEPISKSAFDNLINRDGLPRERQNRPRWRDGQLVRNEQWMYRLGDVWAMRRDKWRRERPLEQAPEDDDQSPDGTLEPAAES